MLLFGQSPGPNETRSGPARKARMKRIFAVINRKQAELDQVQKEIEALRIAAALLSDAGEQRSTVAPGSAVSPELRAALVEHASLTRSQEWFPPGPVIPICTTLEESQHDPGGMRNALSALPAIGDAIPFGRSQTDAEAGQICDVCGRANDEHAFVCEQCDVPLPSSVIMNREQRSSQAETRLCNRSQIS